MAHLGVPGLLRLTPTLVSHFHGSHSLHGSCNLHNLHGLHSLHDLLYEYVMYLYLFIHFLIYFLSLFFFFVITVSIILIIIITTTIIIIIHLFYFIYLFIFLNGSKRRLTLEAREDERKGETSWEVVVAWEKVDSLGCWGIGIKKLGERERGKNIK